MQDERKKLASEWFTSLRDEICNAFEDIEARHVDGPLSDRPAGKFLKEKTTRDNGKGGGGEMSIMKDGRLFEKVGVNISTVYGQLNERMVTSMVARKSIKGLSENPVFWASGISLVAHMNSPHIPAVHMNTRMFWTPVAGWFGGGMDLNPMLENKEDKANFHGTLEKMCAKHDADYYPKFKEWADEYFLIKHWKETRGVGGIFFDDLDTGNWDADFDFTKDVGSHFLNAYLPCVEKSRKKSWSEEERDIQLIKRGRYAEFNLVYDRGTHFGLQSGHDPRAVLMSLPPIAKWP